MNNVNDVLIIIYSTALSAYLEINRLAEIYSLA